MHPDLVGPILGLIAAVIGAAGGIIAALLRYGALVKSVRTGQGTILEATETAALEREQNARDLLAAVESLRTMQSNTWANQMKLVGEQRALAAEVGRLTRARQADHDRITRIETALDLGLMPTPTRRSSNDGHEQHEQ